MKTNKQRGKEWRERNPGKTTERVKQWRLDNPEKDKANRSKEVRNPESNNARQSKYAKSPQGRAASKRYYENNKHKFAEKAARRRAKIKNLTPSWYCKDTVLEIYNVAREFGLEVDHIVPLDAGGLHSHENLQLLTKSENSKKRASQ